MSILRSILTIITHFCQDETPVQGEPEYVHVMVLEIESKIVLRIIDGQGRSCGSISQSFCVL